jgi:hypothetical protein
MIPLIRERLTATASATAAEALDERDGVRTLLHCSTAAG